MEDDTYDPRVLQSVAVSMTRLSLCRFADQRVEAADLKHAPHGWQDVADREKGAFTLTVENEEIDAGTVKIDLPVP